MTRYFSDSIFNHKTTLDEANKKHSNLLNNILEFNSTSRPKVETDLQKDTCTNSNCTSKSRRYIR